MGWIIFAAVMFIIVITLLWMGRIESQITEISSTLRSIESSILGIKDNRL